MNALAEYKSRIAGLNADLAVYSDRVEWSRKGAYKFSRVLLAWSTCGITYCFKWGRERTTGTRRMLPLSQVRAVNTLRMGPRRTMVTLVTGQQASDLLLFLKHDDAAEFVAFVESTILARARVAR